jgi:hypothetical protein
MNHQDPLPKTTWIFVDLGGSPNFWRNFGEFVGNNIFYAYLPVPAFLVVESLKLQNEKIQFIRTSFTFSEG